MSQIRVLPDQIANQIAAGEVVERPAAVVKELLENSLDSGASRVDVVFRKGGMQYLKISDNGPGMSQQEALLALERHATSKLRQIDDLRAILSYGFRGEALPSIASVSRFLLRTRRAEEATGTEILVLGGKIQHVRECGMPPGTVIEIDRLFYNVPARRKFLKKESTEAAHILHLLKLYALASPQTAFTLKEDKRVLLSTPPCPTLRDRIGELFGREITTNLVPISLTEEDRRIEGLAGTPVLQRGTRQDILFFVNGRPVDSRLLTFASLEAYRNHLPRGRFPFIIAHLEIPPEIVDVNVHPTKREVRFRQELAMRQLVIHAIWDLLEIQRNRSAHAGLITLPGNESTDSDRSPPSDLSIPTPAVATTALQDQRDTPKEPSSRVTPARSSESPPVPMPIAVPSKAPLPRQAPAATASTSFSAIPEPSVSPLLQQLPEWQYLGKLNRKMLLFSHPQGLTLVNEAAARRRIAFEQTLVQLEAGQLSSQTLIFPLPLELNTQESRLIRESLPLFQEIGIQIEEFGKSWFRIAAIPALVPPEQAEHLVRGMLAWLQETSSTQRAGQEGRQWIAARISTFSSQEQPVTSPENAFTLVRELLTCRSPMVSPAGNPTVVEITMGELQRRFFPQARNFADWEE